MSLSSRGSGVGISLTLTVFSSIFPLVVSIFISEVTKLFSMRNAQEKNDVSVDDHSIKRLFQGI
jgi:hypothetical protein